MSLATYDDLLAAIATALDRTDLTAVAPVWVALAEAALARDVRHWRMETRSTTTLSARYTDLPDDWVETVRLTVGMATTGYRALAYMGRDEMERERGRSLDVSGVPQFYGHVGGTLEVLPTPSGSYTGELVYFARPAALSSSATSNWLLDRAPDAYLYGALVHSAPHLVEDARLPMWTALYDGAVARLNADGMAAVASGTSLRLRPPRR